MEKVSFSGSKISLISRCEGIVTAHASCTRKLLRLLCRETLCVKTLYSGIELGPVYMDGGCPG